MADQEEWRKVAPLAPHALLWRIERLHVTSSEGTATWVQVATCNTEADADIILRDHQAEVRWANVEKVLAEREARIAELEADYTSLFTDDQRHMRESSFAAKDCPLDPACRATGGCHQGHSGRSETCEVAIASDLIGGLRDRMEEADRDAETFKALVEEAASDLRSGIRSWDWLTRAKTFLYEYEGRLKARQLIRKVSK